MKSILCLLVFAAAVSQISAKKLNVTIFYETLCKDCFPLFKNQIWPAYQDKNIQQNVEFELIAFGKASYTASPWNYTCQHGPRECHGNMLDACFLAKYHGDNYKQVAMISCTMSDPDPPSAGEKCAKKLGYNYEGVELCARDDSNIGKALTILHGDRTLKFKPKITFIPTVVYDNVYNEKDQKESLTNFKNVVLRKLKEKGVYINEE